MWGVKGQVCCIHTVSVQAVQLGCGFTEVLHPALLAQKQPLARKGGCAPAGDGAEGQPGGDLEQGPGFQIPTSPSIAKKRINALGQYSALIYSPTVQQTSRDIATEVPPNLYYVDQSRLSAALIA